MSLTGGALALSLASPGLAALDISGSTTVQPIIERLVPIFTEQTGEPVRLAGGGSGAGIKNALSGASQIGMVSRDLKSEERTELRHTTIGLDALAIIREATPSVSAFLALALSPRGQDVVRSLGFLSVDR
ncbi:MAG: substrate-binding domain-containing protein [Thermochromatium sp.]